MIKIQFLLPTLINNTSQSRMFEMSYSYLYLPFSVDFSCSLPVLFIIDSPKTLPSRIFQKCFSCSPFKHTSQFLYTQPRGILPVLFLRVSVFYLSNSYGFQYDVNDSPPHPVHSRGQGIRQCNQPYCSVPVRIITLIVIMFKYSYKLKSLVNNIATNNQRKWEVGGGVI